MDMNNKRLLQQIITKSPNYIFWKDADLIYRGCNYNFARAAGFESPQQLIGKTDNEMKWGQFTGSIYQAEDRQIIATGKPILNKEVLMVMEENHEQFLSISKAPLYNDQGSIIGILGIYIDITRQKEMEKNLIHEKEKAENANKAKTDFLYNVRHDIRTPFSGLLSLSLFLEQSEENPEKKEYLHDIAQSAQELLNYLNEIIEYMELEDSSVPVLYKPIQLRELIGEIVTMMKPAVKYKSVQIKTEISSDIPQEIIGDRYRIHRILLNLVGNAVKFTKEGCVIIGAEIAKKEDRKFFLKLWIKDTGIGIPEEKYNFIFERFNRLTASYSGTYKGTGLGLWAVKLLMDELGGQIFVESEIDKGSLFTCVIPFERMLLE